MLLAEIIPGTGDHRDVADLGGLRELGDDRKHRGGLGLVPLERGHLQRKPGCIRQQPERDLRLEAPFLEVPGLREPVTAVGLEVQRARVLHHQDAGPALRASRTPR
jgi:hypothetical protein